MHTRFGAYFDDGTERSGNGGGLFGTDDPVTVEQLDVVMGRYLGQEPAWTGDPARAVPATRVQVAVALYENMAGKSAGRVLVAYFSRPGENYNVGTVEKGNTAVVAELIAGKTGGNLFEIRPTTPYPSNYNEMLSVARQESSQNARPETAEAVNNMADYDVVLLGYPIWNGDMPMIVYNFLETYDLSGKTVVPFCTHEGSGILNRTPSTPATGNAGGFDLEKGTVTLNNGIAMPILGIGTFQLSQSQAENSVYWALRDGYRLIDTARIYGNEEGVGGGIRRAINEGFVKREDIFVTTKMRTSDYGNGAAAIDASLRRLGLDYIDLMILHHSQPSNDVAAYQAMEQAVRQGKLRTIGLSNYYTPEDFDRLRTSSGADF